MVNFCNKLLWLVLLVTIISCSKDDDGFKKGYGDNLMHLDIADATNLLIVSNKNSSTTKSVKSAVNQETNVLYKMMEGGVLKQVSHIDKEGNVLEDGKYYQPFAVKNLNDDYVVLCYETPYDITNNLHCYIVRKSDGAVFEAPLASSENDTGYFSKVDINIGDDNFYYKGRQSISGGLDQSAMIKLFLDNSGNIFEKQISIESDGSNQNGFAEFYADAYGNYIYSRDHYHDEEHRVITKSGSISSQVNLNPKAVGPDGYVYSINEKDVFRLVIGDDATITKELYGILSENIDVNNFYKLGDKVLSIEPSGKVVDIFGSGDDIKVHSPIEGLIDGDTKVMVSGDYYFFAGYKGSQLKIYRMNYKDHLAIEIPVDFSSFEFKLDNVMVVNENEVICSGLRLSDAAWVTYKADFSGNIELMDEDFHNMEVIQLERIQ